jgi:hypothetical protein
MMHLLLAEDEATMAQLIADSLEATAMALKKKNEYCWYRYECAHFTFSRTEYTFRYPIRFR